MERDKIKEFLWNTNIDIHDIRILVCCLRSPLSIAELQRQVGIAYKNLLPHIKKLKANRMIIVKDNGKGKKKFITINQQDLGIAYFMFGLIALFSNPKTLKKHKKLYKEINSFLDDTKQEKK